LETIFWVKILKLFDAYPGSGIRDGKNSDPGWKKVGSGINIPDPQHWYFCYFRLPLLQPVHCTVLFRAPRIKQCEVGASYDAFLNKPELCKVDLNKGGNPSS
jgi:hypothetical protein